MRSIVYLNEAVLNNQNSIATNENLAQQVREARKKKKLTLEETAALTGIGRSTLSKIENNQTVPSFDIVRKLVTSLNLHIPQLFVQTPRESLSGRRDINKKGEGFFKSTQTYDHEVLCNNLINKEMIPYLSQIKARDISEFEDWIRHKGEEFLFVVEGEIEFHTEYYTPVRMCTGDSAYYDSGMGHFCISVSEKDAKILWITKEQL